MRTKSGFTLVELLVVISIIALLVGMLLPTVQRVKKLARNVRTGANIANLILVCETYYLDHDRCYPGQHHPEMLTGGDGHGNFGVYTGSQLLAGMELHASELETFEIHAGKLRVTDNPDIPASLSDEMLEPMPILYYPARPGLTGAVLEVWQEAVDVDQTWQHVWIFNEYLYDDNAAYFATDRHQDFYASIREERFTEVRPRNPGKFLFIAAGMDREYFTSDDLEN